MNIINRLSVCIAFPVVVTIVVPQSQNVVKAFALSGIHHKPTRKEFQSSSWSSATEYGEESSVASSDDFLPSFLSDSDEFSPPLHESEYTQVLSTMSLSPIAQKLRDAYDDHFRDPRQPNGDRFAWDPWFVSAGDGRKHPEKGGPDEDEDIVDEGDAVDGEKEALANQIQYSLKRIQTSQFFPEDNYNVLVDDLVSLANSIGLTAISPPWTSMYTDGDMQNFHTDSTHGPMAFVLSLSKEGDFMGGETMIMQPEVLDLWRNFEAGNAMECGNIIR